LLCKLIAQLLRKSGAVKTAGPRIVEIAQTLYPTAKVGDTFSPAVSKVVDKNGEPLVVYHGTGENFEQFDKDKLGTSTKHPTAKIGFYANANSKIAESFTPVVQAPEGKWYQFIPALNAKVLPLFMNIKNPRVVTPQEFSKIRTGGFKLELNGYDGLKISADPEIEDLFGGMEYSADNFAALQPEQIKSVFNRGSYIKDDPAVQIQPEYPQYENFKVNVTDGGKDVGHIFVTNDGEYLTTFKVETKGERPNVGTSAILKLADWARKNGLTLRSDRLENRMSDAYKKLWRRFLITGQAEVQHADDGTYYIFTGTPEGVTGNIYAQTEDTEGSKASADTLRKVNEFLKRIGVDVKKVNNIVVNGQKIGANGVADITNKLIQVIDGKEDVALTEEAAHFAVELVEQTNPQLFNQLINKVGNYQLYRAVFNTYKDVYKTPDGKPDIRKIKKEGVGKVLSEYIIRNNEGSTEKSELLAQSRTWWEAILDYLKRLFGSAGFNPFEVAAEAINNEDIGTLENLEGGTFFQVDKGSAVFNKLQDKHNQLSKKEVLDENGESKEAYFIGGKQVANRVTDKAKAYENSLFGKKEVTPEQAKFWDVKKEKGTAGHKDMEEIFNMYVDSETGFRRDNPLDRPGPSHIGSEAAWKLLHDNFAERLSTFPAGTRFMSEVRIYDEVSDTAGTMDLVAISPEGSVSIYDWKFIDIDTTKTKDIPWYKKRSFNIQLGSYKDILSKRYGIKEFKQVRVIPLKATYSYLKKKEGGRDLVFSKVEIGSVNVKEIEQDYLLPYALTGESTGNPKLDKLIDQLNAILHKLEVSTAKKGEQFDKYEKINTLNSAIRKLQIQGNADLLADQGLGLIKRYKELIDKYNKDFQGKDPKDLPQDTQEKMAEELFDAHNILDVYSDIDIIMKSANVDMDEDLTEKLQDLSSNARLIKGDVEEVSKKLTNDFIAKGVGINTFLNPERAITYLKKMFRSFSQAQTSATRVLYKIVDPIIQKTTIRYNAEIRTLSGLRDNLLKWASQNNIDTKNVFKPLLSLDSNGRWTGKLVDKIDKKFYEEFQGASDLKDKKWFEENTDLKAYREWFKEEKAKRIARIKEGRYFADDEQNAKKQQSLINDFTEEYDIDENPSTALGNWKLKQLALESKWTSKEYAYIKQNKPLSDFYDYMQDKLRHSYDLGLLKAWQYRTFIPNIRNDGVERMVFGGKYFAPHSNWIERNLAVRNDDQIYGYKDPLTGEVIDNLGVHYTADLGVKILDSEGREFKDYSEKSQDLFKVFSLWNEQIIKYEYLSEVESRVRLLHLTEGMKRSIATNQFGNPLRERDANGKIVADALIEIEDNKANQEYLKKFIDYYLYGKQMTDAASLDIMIPNAYSKLVEKINKKVGFKVLPEMKTEGNFSLAKMISAANRFFQMKVLGLNVATAVSNLAGGTMNNAIQAGKFFTKSDLAAALAKLGSTKFHGDEESKKLAGLIDLISPLVENRKPEQARELSISKAVNYLSSDWLFSLQRGSDKIVEYPITIAVLMNSTIVDGKILNIPELVRKNNNYENLYNLSPAEQKALRDKINREIEEMKKSSSLIKQATIQNDEIQLEGVSIDELAKLRNFIQQISKNSVGNASKEDINQIRLSLIGQSLMMFKNWIPRLVDTRFGELRYNVGTDSYEYGRVRMFLKALSLNIFQGIGRINGMIKGSEKGLQFLKDEFAKKKLEFEERGEEFTLTEQEYIDMYIRGIKAEMKELALLFSMFSMFVFMKANAPDDDDDPRTKGFWKWTTRTSDRIQQELSFFYSPTTIAQIGNGSLFPSLGFLVDMQKIVNHVSTQAFGFAVQNEEVQDSAQPLKYIFRAFPITKEGLTWLAILNKDIADSMDVKLSTQARPNQ
jgi:hypothetical protein